jgi:hypothetical protein
MKLSIFVVLVLSVFQVNLALADQYVYADDSVDLDEPTSAVTSSTFNAELYVYADDDVDLDEPIVTLISSTFNAELYVYADDDVDLDEPASAVTSNSGSADEKQVSSTNQLSEIVL